MAQQLLINRQILEPITRGVLQKELSEKLQKIRRIMPRPQHLF